MNKLYAFLVGLTLCATPLPGQARSEYGALRLADFAAQDLLDARRTLMQALIATGTDVGDPANVAARALLQLDLAELHLAKMMRPEAADYLAVIDAGALQPDARQRYDTLQLALALLSDGDARDVAVDQSVGWQSGQVLRAVALFHMDRDVEAVAILPQAIASLPTLSGAMAAAVLPTLLELALTAEDWEGAKALASLFPIYAELRDSAAYRFLLAQASEQTGDLVMAVDGYAAAARGRDAYAQRARLAIVKLGRRTDTLPLDDAVGLLKTARWAWSGDDIAEDVTQLLADLATESGDYEAALWALNQLVIDAASPGDAAVATGRAEALIDDYYQKGAAGLIDLDAFLDGHAKIMARWGYGDGFVESAKMLPDMLFAAGMTAIAAREFRALRFLAETAEELGRPSSDTALIRDLRRKEAQALLAGGQADAAVDLLIGFANHFAGDPAAERILIQALSQAGRSDELADLRILATDLDTRRSGAAAFYQDENWPMAQQSLLSLWAAYPVQFVFSDAVRLALAAYRIDDTATVVRVATAFPSLTDLPGWAEIATSLTGGTTDGAVFSTETMRQSIQNADRALDAVTQASEKSDIFDE